MIRRKIERNTWFKIFKYLVSIYSIKKIMYLNSFELNYLRYRTGVEITLPSKKMLNKYAEYLPELCEIFQNLSRGFAFPGMFVEEGDYVSVLTENGICYRCTASGNDLLVDFWYNSYYDITLIKRGDKIIYEDK